jgi:hypothetical protein
MGKKIHHRSLKHQGRDAVLQKPGKKREKGDFLGIKLYRARTGTEALLSRKSKAHQALPSYSERVLMDNRHPLIVHCNLTQAKGTGE